MKWGVLGAGKLTSSIFSRMTECFPTDEFYFYTPSKLSAQTLANKLNGHIILDLEKLKDMDVIYLGMKPQQFQAALKLYSPYIHSSQIIVSVLAAVELGQLQKLGTMKLIRLMPNMLFEVGKSITLMTSTGFEHQEQDNLKNKISCGGAVVETTEKELDAMTLFSGCAPAYWYYMLKQVEDFSQSHQLDPEKAKLIFWKTFQSLFESTHEIPKDLDEKINAITSKGGVTRAVLDQFSSDQYKNYFLDAWDAGMKRLDELKKS